MKLTTKVVDPVLRWPSVNSARKKVLQRTPVTIMKFQTSPQIEGRRGLVDLITKAFGVGLARSASVFARTRTDDGLWQGPKHVSMKPEHMSRFGGIVGVVKR